MGSSVSEEEDEPSDQQSERCGSYSPSADVSEPESSTNFLASLRFLSPAGPSGSVPSSPLDSRSSRSAGTAAPSAAAADGVSWKEKLEKAPHDFSEVELMKERFAEVEMMKERFAKLLLGEDMSGSGKGVCTALAISNAITNLSATVFGELWRLEPLEARKKSMWRREMEWLLSVSDHIVDLTPSQVEFPGGGTYEVMVSRLRSDLCMNLPGLKKLDSMLIGMLDGFVGTEFWYADRSIIVAGAEVDSNEDGYPSPSFGRPSLRQEDKWWLPCPRVPPNGLSQDGRKVLQQCKDRANQILKAAMAINSGVLVEMEIPQDYIETLPKSGKSCLGEIIYGYITADQFSPDSLLDYLDLSSEYHALEIANRIEAAIHMWSLKSGRHPHLGKSKSWSGKVMGLVIDNERNLFLAQRAQGLLQSLRLRCPVLPQTLLDMNKIQYNKDVGQSILESYSRVLESLAFNIIARIDDLLYVDDAVKESSSSQAMSQFNPGPGGLPIQKRISPSPFSIQNTPYASSPFATTPYCSSPIIGSPPGSQPSLNKGGFWKLDLKLGKLIPDDIEKLWLYTGSLSSRKDAGEVPERD